MEIEGWNWEWGRGEMLGGGENRGSRESHGENGSDMIYGYNVMEESGEMADIDW
jgi:hypothetical protein